MTALATESRDVEVAAVTRTTPVALAGAALIASVVGLAVLSLARQSGIAAWHTVWAEDGAVFFHDNAVEGVRAFATTYSGYLVTLPRAIAFAGGVLTVQHASQWYAVAGALVTSLLGVVFYWFTDFLIGSRVLRGVLAASFVLQPLVGYELLNNATNTIWPLTVVCFVALLRPPRHRTDTLVASGVVFLAVTSQVLCALWIPIAALAIWRRPRDRKTQVVVGAYALGLVLQTIALVTASTTGPREATNLSDLPAIYAVRVLGSALLGERWVSDSWISRGMVVAVLVALFVAGMIVLLVRRAPRAAVADAAIAIGASVVFFAVAVGYRGTAGITLRDGQWTQAMSRFMFVALELFLLGLFVLVDRARMRDGTRQILVALVVLQLVVIGSTSFRYTNGRSAGPVWSQSVSTASEQCGVAPRPRETSIAFSPPPIWATAVRCSWLSKHD